MTTTRQSAIDIINRAHHRREPEPLLDLLADDAELVTFDRGGAEARVTSGKPAIEAEMRDVFARDMTHEVRDMVAGGDRLGTWSTAATRTAPAWWAASSASWTRRGASPG